MTPEGFVEIHPSAGNAFLAASSRIWARLDGAVAVMGFRVEDRHTNPMGICHGGMLLTFADTFLPTAIRLQERVEDGFTPTVSLNADFLAPAKRGQWVEGRAQLLKRTGTLLYVSGLVTGDDGPIMRVSALFKRGKRGERAGRLSELLEMIGKGAHRSG
jgi:uncharacterized protein (TIGR00369 family)